jgi:putative ABC transport system permease protein
MKDGTAGAGSGRGSQWLRRSLIVTEVALAFVVLSGAGLLIRSFLQIQKVDTGFDATNLTTAYLPIDDKRFSSTAELMVYLRQVLDRMSSLPGVSDVALTTAPPINWGWGLDVPFHVLGTDEPDLAHRPHCGLKVVSASYFSTMGMTLKEGRLLNEHDVEGSLPATVISESMARKYSPEGSPVGRHILAQQQGMTRAALGPEVPWEIVGVVKDEKNGDLRDENKPGMYVPLEQSPTGWQFLVVRGAINPNVLERSMRAALRELNGDQVMDNLVTLDWVKSNALASDRRRSWMLGIFAVVALLLAAVGLYGVISYSVAQRTREIGIRTALGATPKAILGLVLRNGMGLTAVGLLFGIGGAIGLSQIIASLLFNVGKYDPPTLAAVGLILALTSLLACIFPARRATKVNPIVALRSE